MQVAPPSLELQNFSSIRLELNLSCKRAVRRKCGFAFLIFPAKKGKQIDKTIILPAV
jgi:hypothetical protein